MVSVSKFGVVDMSLPPPWQPVLQGLYHTFQCVAGEHPMDAWRLETLSSRLWSNALLATIFSCQCLSLPCCLKATLIFKSTFFVFHLICLHRPGIWHNWIRSCLVQSDSIHLLSDSILNYGWYQVFKRGNRNILPLGSVFETADPAHWQSDLESMF